MDGVVDGVQEGKANIGLLTWGMFDSETEEALSAKGLHFERLKKRELKAFVCTNSSLAEAPYVDLEDLDNKPMVSYSSSFRNTLMRHLDVAENAVILRDKEDMRRSIYEEGTIALLPDLYAEDNIYCDQDLIKCIPVKDEDHTFIGYDTIIWPAKRTLSVIEKQVIKILHTLL